MTAPERRHAPGPDGGRPGSGAAAPVAVPPLTTAQLVDRVRDEWRARLVARGGHSALADVDRLGDAQLDLSAAHPSGIAQLFAGRPTRLSNLVREGSALSTAKRRARAVGVLADEHAQRYGIASAFLAIGVATWTETRAAGDAAEPADDVAVLAAATRGASTTRPAGTTSAEPDADAATRTVRAPVLLRPVAVTARGRGESDYDLVLEPSLEINPLLATALRSRGALLDPTALARGAFTASGFDPRPALERLTSLGSAVLDDFRLEDRLLVGTFVHPEQALVADLDAQALSLHQHELVAALAGDQRAIDALQHPLPTPLRGDRPLDQERGVGDLDPVQEYVLDAVAAGHHLLVDAPAGSDVAGTLAAVVADAAASGRTVLYVPGHRRAAQALTDRLTGLGLDELVLDVAPDSGWRASSARRLLAAMTVEPVPVDGEKVAIVQRELLDRRRRLSGYIEGLHAVREPWGTSAYDALQALARLTSVRPAPQTTVRLTPPVAESLTGERRAQAATDLVRAAGLGAFSASSRTTPWYGADLPTQDRAAAALARIERLVQVSLPRLQAEVERVADATGLTPARTPAQWAEQLAMLAGVRGALDVFQPLVFERSAADLVAATAPKGWREERGIEMSGGLRRRLRKQAKDMVRPGRPVADLHAALVDVQAQRELWQAHCPAGGWPRIPDGLADIEHDFAEVREDLDALAAVLANTVQGGALLDLPWAELGDRLRRLHLDRSALETLPERTALVRALDRQGLGPLLSDLAERGVPAVMVTAELELAWWSTVLEQLLAADPALAGYDGTALARLVAEFRTLDLRHLQDRALLAKASARESLRTRLRAADEETQQLFGDIVEDRFTTLRHAVERYPAVTRHLRPCLVSAPMLVPHLLPPRRTEDLVILDAANHLPLETVLCALARGRQVVVVGDTRCASGTAMTELAAVLPSIPLHADSSRRDPHLTQFLADHGYAGRLVATPLPSVSALLRLDVVDGSGMPAASGAVEATRAEVEHVVDLVAEHALTRPEESLAVVTASPAHAEAVRDAVMAEVRDNPALGAFFRVDHPEPFAVVDVAAAQGLSREAVIFSLGFGRTPHGRVLHRFGAISEQGGAGLLLEALGSVRRRLTVVSCFGPEELDPDRLRAPGAQMLAELLALAGERTAAGADVGRPRPAPHGPEPDRLVLDLAERLWRMGLTVDLDHGLDGSRIPLVVGHPDLPDAMLVAVLTDDAAYVDEPSVRVRDRQIPERLERLGWTVVQVWSAAAFLDPQGEADAVAAAVADAYRRRRASTPRPRPRLTVPQMAPEAAIEAATEAVQDPAAAPAQDRAPEPGPAADDAVVPPVAPVVPVATVTRTVTAPPPSASAPSRAAAPPVRTSAVGRAAVMAAPSDAPTMDPLFEVPDADGRSPRPDVEPGLPIGAYSDDQLDDVVAWIRSDGIPRSAEDLATALRTELRLARRGSRVDAAVNGAVKRSR
ncbi:hypothetical protein ICW40_02520 [Actinotalea ferrariae]|uniref:hypothetical protein n=1 Tax=Actinotalea ferrariae TaxID=1386098 RepID=UPI001C8C77AA|nr:hypothetical protein [Actinotalea ferrariae]MBX9243678.1 hypothetical protein [Actinotalea ferrariae]